MSRITLVISQICWCLICIIPDRRRARWIDLLFCDTDWYRSTESSDHPWCDKEVNCVRTCLYGEELAVELVWWSVHWISMSSRLMLSEKTKFKRESGSVSPENVSNSTHRSQSSGMTCRRSNIQPNLTHGIHNFRLMIFFWNRPIRCRWCNRFNFEVDSGYGIVAVIIVTCVQRARQSRKCRWCWIQHATLTTRMLVGIGSIRRAGLRVRFRCRLVKESAKWKTQARIFSRITDTFPLSIYWRWTMWTGNAGDVSAWSVVLTSWVMRTRRMRSISLQWGPIFLARRSARRWPFVFFSWFRFAIGSEEDFEIQISLIVKLRLPASSTWEFRLLDLQIEWIRCLLRSGTWTLWRTNKQRRMSIADTTGIPRCITGGGCIVVARWMSMIDRRHGWQG